jgi:uncharacterized repeat protein (TIGR04076 family)
MRRAIATVERVSGTCNAGYRVGDKIVVNLENALIVTDESDALCIFALGAILANMARLRGGEEILAACPDPATGLGGNVIFHVVKEYQDESVGKSV